MYRFNEPVLVTRPLLPCIEKINMRIKDIWDSKWLTNNGSQHKELEKKLKDYLKVENFVLYSNGTLALMIGLKALDLRGEVITTPFTFPATVMALDWCGLTPVFCDIEKNTFNIDADLIESHITPETSAILAVHVFGNPCRVDKIQHIADKYNLKVIYDGAHTFGSSIDTVSIGNFGDMTMFSFHATKLFNTIEGGGLAFRDVSLEKKLNLMKNFGINGPEEVLMSGINAKLNEVQSAMGLEVLDIVSAEREKRKHLAVAYMEELDGIKGIRIISRLNSENSSYQYFAIEIEESLYGVSRDKLYEELQKCNVFTRKYFYPLCSDFKWYEGLFSAKPENLPQAHKTVNEVLTLPFYGELETDTVIKICEIIRFIGKQ